MKLSMRTHNEFFFLSLRHWRRATFPWAIIVQSEQCSGMTWTILKPCLRSDHGKVWVIESIFMAPSKVNNVVTTATIPNPQLHINTSADHQPNWSWSRHHKWYNSMPPKPMDLSTSQEMKASVVQTSDKEAHVTPPVTTPKTALISYQAFQESP